MNGNLNLNNYRCAKEKRNCETGLVFSLGTFVTVLQAEVFVIMTAVRESIARGYNGRTITIFTDSQAALNQ